MRLSALAFLMILTTVMLSGCAQEARVVVEDKGSAYYGRQQPNAFAYQSVEVIQAAPVAPVATQALKSPENTLRYTHLPSTRWQWPVRGKITQAVGPVSEGVVNEGITIAVDQGALIRAAHAGEVAYVGSNVRDYGNMVIVRHADATFSLQCKNC